MKNGMLLLVVLPFILPAAGCNKKSVPTYNFSTDVPDISVSQFINQQTFQGKLDFRHSGTYLDKTSGKTNYFFNIVLKEINGERFSVFYDSTQQDLYMAVNFLETNKNYDFPDVLKVKPTRQP